MELDGTNIKQQLSNNFCCKKCNYITHHNSNLATHMARAKHLKELNGTDFKQTSGNKFECVFFYRLCEKSGHDDV